MVCGRGSAGVPHHQQLCHTRDGNTSLLRRPLSHQYGLLVPKGKDGITPKSALGHDPLNTSRQLSQHLLICHETRPDTLLGVQYRSIPSNCPQKENCDWQADLGLWTLKTSSHTIIKCKDLRARVLPPSGSDLNLPGLHDWAVPRQNCQKRLPVAPFPLIRLVLFSGESDRVQASSLSTPQSEPGVSACPFNVFPCADRLAQTSHQSLCLW